ncbi:hypothetical protein ES708_34727 [subsurface metagenome]
MVKSKSRNRAKREKKKPRGRQYKRPNVDELLKKRQGE